MKYLIPSEIREEIAEKKNITVNEVRCSHCKNWAYNNGGIQTSMFTSKCKVYKSKTIGNQFCRQFTLDK